MSNITIEWHQACDANFKARFEFDFTVWMRNHTSFTVEVREENIYSSTFMAFDHALVMNGLHGTTSPWDPNPAHHVTVRLSTPALRQQDAWYTLHWRPGGGSVVGPRPSSRLALEGRRARAKNTKKRRKQREKLKKDEDKKDGHDGASGQPQVTSGRA